MTAVAKPAAWFDNSFGARAKITLSKDMAVGSTQSNYPFKLTSLHNVIYGLSRSDGQDIVVTDSDGVTEIERDVASFDRLARSAELYVKLPSMSSVADPVVYLYFNNPAYYRGNDRVDHSITRRIRVAASADDCIVAKTVGVWSMLALNNANFGVGYEAAANYTYIGSAARWLGVNSPKYATVNLAKFIWTSRITGAEVIINSRIWGELSGTPATFSTLADYQPRCGTASGGADNTKRTASQVDYDGIAAAVLDTEYSSPDCKTVVQEIADNNSIQDLVLFWNDHEARGTQAGARRRYGYSYDGSAAKALLLLLDFTPLVTNYQTIELQYLGLEGNL